MLLVESRGSAFEVNIGIDNTGLEISVSYNLVFPSYLPNHQERAYLAVIPRTANNSTLAHAVVVERRDCCYLRQLRSD